MFRNSVAVTPWRWPLLKLEFDRGSSLLNELKTRALSKFVVVAMFFVYIINK